MKPIADPIRSIDRRPAIAEIRNMIVPPRRTRIKFCGLRTPADVDAAVRCGVDAVGFVFVAASPRYIAPSAAADLVALLPPLVEPIGLFADATADHILEVAQEVALRAIQLHGSEDEQFVRELTSDFVIIRGIRFSSDQVKRWAENGDVDILLIDGSHGGEGTAFDWRQLVAPRRRIKMPLMLAGGLEAGNVERAIGLIAPFAVDVSSGIESRPGRKDPAQMSDFVAAVARADGRS